MRIQDNETRTDTGGQEQLWKRLINHLRKDSKDELYANKKMNRWSDWLMYGDYPTDQNSGLLESLMRL